MNPSILKINVINERILQNEMETFSNHNISSWSDIKSVPSKYKMEKVEGGLEEIDWWINNK